ncbi:DUF2726 domain-containing protein [Paraherbaspirillum soli]|uniref:DUF2726 domain-containing protein n=1 Tax=Paraherbaspirillum soli TaxID=631222 RepID=A0ABW0MCC9_9BURK
MNIIIALVVVAIIVIGAVVGIAARGKKKATTSKSPGFYKKKPLSDNEQVMYRRLINALPDYTVLAQVDVSRCLGAKNATALNDIGAKNLDFVICNRSGEAIAVVEIGDKSHGNKALEKKEEMKNKVLKKVGIDIVRWRAGTLPSEADIQARFILLDPIKQTRSTKPKSAASGNSASIIPITRNTRTG